MSDYVIHRETLVHSSRAVALSLMCFTGLSDKLLSSRAVRVFNVKAENKYSTNLNSVLFPVLCLFAFVFERGNGFQAPFVQSENARL